MMTGASNLGREKFREAAGDERGSNALARLNLEPCRPMVNKQSSTRFGFAAYALRAAKRGDTRWLASYLYSGRPLTAERHPRR